MNGIFWWVFPSLRDENGGNMCSLQIGLATVILVELVVFCIMKTRKESGLTLPDSLAILFSSGG